MKLVKIMVHGLIVFYYTMLDHFRNDPNVSLQTAFDYAKKSYATATGNASYNDQPMILTTTNTQQFYKLFIIVNELLSKIS